MLKQVQHFRPTNGNHSEDFCLCEPVHTILTQLYIISTNVGKLLTYMQQISTFAHICGAYGK